MSRLDYDVVFYRVFCVTLLAVAFTFIVILTNVFIDIDGLLSNKKKFSDLPDISPIPEPFIYDEDSPLDLPKYLISNEDKNYDSETNPLYRTKRSIESETGYQVKSPAMKNMLTRRFASLLEELDVENTKKEIKFEITTTKEVGRVTKNDEDYTLSIRNKDLLHFAMHNILLQGLKRHTDLNDIYKKFHELIKIFNKRSYNKITQDEKLTILNTIANSKEAIKEVPEIIKRYHYNEEHKFFEEIMKCKKLADQVAGTTVSSDINTKNENKTEKDDKVVTIKVVIEISDKNQSKVSSKTQKNENVEGLIKLIYNGKPIKINQFHDEIISQNSSKAKEIRDTEEIKNSVNNKAYSRENKVKNMEMIKNNHTYTPSPLLKTVLDEYYLQKVKTQRSKRQIKIRYSNNVTKSSKTEDVAEGKDDDDFYIEIETHFDGKGIKGEKKKKLVRSLIDKIQKALHSDIQKRHDSVEHIKFVKRMQDPIYSQNKISLSHKLAPLEPIEHRQIDPIGKTSEIIENIADKNGVAWKRQYNGPNFLSVSKSVNSAEMNELKVDYDSILKNGISKRLQRPLITETVDEDGSTGLLNPNSGNVTLFLKDIGSSGFSIGFNQYEGEPPDKDSMKMFNGIENLIREYHNTYDQADNISNESVLRANNNLNLVETGHEIAKRNVENLHNIYRRSIAQVGTNYYNANIYSIVFKKDPSFDKYLNTIINNNILNLQHNQELKFRSRIRHGKKKQFNAKSNDILLLPSNVSLRKMPLTVDESILNKKLTPSKFFTTANLVNRNRRSLSMKKISSLKSKIKLNRFLNTKAMASKNIFLMKKRNKRQVNNVKIITKDRPKAPPKNSDENIFFISRENTYSDKETMIRAVETADTRIHNKNNEYYDEESPFDNIYRIQNPNSQVGLAGNVYNTALRSNRLMSQYPHILLDNSKSKEEAYFNENYYRTNDKPYRIEPSAKPAIGEKEIESATEHYHATDLQNLSEPKVEQLLGAQIQPGRNYKITVKMSPKNKTNTNQRFKEVHTTVNKSFDEHGLRYYTLLNVSQISKIETLNKSEGTKDMVQSLSDPLRYHQNQIKELLKLHKKTVDLQLNTLLRESGHLANLIEMNKKYSMNKTINLLTNNGKSLENGGILLDSLRILQDTTDSITVKPIPTTSKLINALPFTTEIPKTDRSIILDTIKQNEKVTFQILKKIDTNTQILQTFLQKISEKLDLDKKDHTTVKTTENSAVEVKLDLSKNWKTYGVNKDTFFISNERQNDTIPFVYAYQQSIPTKNRTPPQILTSIVYHGHIHSNAVNNLNSDNFNKPAPKIEPNVLVNTNNSKRKLNESRLFLNELNNFHVIPNKESVISANIKLNTTDV